MNLISVIVPVFNSEKYIAQCIESILNQTYTNFELVLVDDGSKDSSGEICRCYELQDRRVHYIYQDNSGVSSARNKGIQAAQGDYIAFVDSDDFIKPKMLEVLVKKECDFAMCGYELYDNMNNSVSAYFAGNEFNGTLSMLACNIKDYICPPYLLGPCFKLFRKNIICNNNLIFPLELSYGEDAVFVFEYLIYCRTINVSPYVGYSYRKHGKSTLSGRFLQEKIDINYKINNLIYKLLKQENVDEAVALKILSDRFLECFVSYTKELMNADLPRAKRKKIFYTKYNVFKSKLGYPTRMAHRLVILAGNYKILYPLLNMFKYFSKCN